jgi:hypothetical protein
VACFGIPATLTSDREVQFTSSFCEAFMGRLGEQHNTTTAFHPQSNGMVERFHRPLKEALKACTASSDLPAHLPWVMLGLCTAPREESVVSAAKVVYGLPLLMPGQLLGRGNTLNPLTAGIGRIDLGLFLNCPFKKPVILKM